MLQDNPIEKVREVLSGRRNSPEGEIHTGWSNQERETVCYLLKLKEFDREELDELLKTRRLLGVTPEQIRKWVEMFDVIKGGAITPPRPMWANQVKQFADFEPDHRKLVAWHAKDEEGKSTGKIHPEILRRNMGDVPPKFRGSVVRDINRQRLRDMFDAHGAS
jgi:hypothetical protein